jgi:hypothetical protein
LLLLAGSIMRPPTNRRSYLTCAEAEQLIRMPAKSNEGVMLLKIRKSDDNRSSFGRATRAFV